MSTEARPALSKLWSHPLPHPVGPVAFSPSGLRIAAGTSFMLDAADSVGSLTVWDADGAMLRQTVDDWSVNGLAYSHDGRWLATAEARVHFNLSPQVREWRSRIVDAETGTVRCSHTTNAISRVAFSADDTLVAGLGRREDRVAEVCVFDASSGQPRWSRRLPPIDPVDDPVTLDFGPQGRGVLVAQQAVWKILDAQFGAEQVVMSASATVMAVAYSMDGSAVLAGCADGAVRVYDAGTGALRWQASLATTDVGPITAITCSADGRWVIALMKGPFPARSLIGVYNLADGAPRYSPVVVFGGDRLGSAATLRSIFVNGWNEWQNPGVTTARAPSVIDARLGRIVLHEQQDRVSALASSPDGGRVAFASTNFEIGALDMYDLGLALGSVELGANPTALTMSTGGSALVAVADDAPAVTVIAAESGVRLARKVIPGAIAAIGFVDGGQAVAVGAGGSVRMFSVVGALSWENSAGAAVNALTAVGASAWTAYAAGRSVQLAHSDDGHPRWAAPAAHPQVVTRIAASADGVWVATGCVDRKTRILDADNGSQTFEIAHTGKVVALAFAPGAALLATGNEDGTVVLVDAEGAVERARITAPFGCAHLAFNRDATLLAVAWDDNSVATYELTGAASPPKIRQLDHSDVITALAFSPSEDILALTTSGSTTVFVHDARSGDEIYRVLGPNTVHQLAFSADGALLVTAAAGGATTIWNTHP